MNPNNFFNNFFGGFPQSDPYNPFNPNFTNNIYQTVNQSINNAFGYQNPFGIPGNQGFSNANIDPGNIRINNNYNLNGNMSFEPNMNEFSQNMPNDRSEYQQQQQRTQQPKKKKSEVKKQKQEIEKDEKILEAEKNPNSGHYYKKIGNEFYAKAQYSEALKYYSKAIEVTDSESVFYSNRARVLKKLGEYKRAYEDAKQAVELDDKNIKAHLLCGQLLATMSKSESGLEKINLAINRMTKSLTLCSGQNKKDFEKDLEKNILKAKKLKWYKEQQFKRQQKLDFLNFIKTMIASMESQSEEEKEAKIKAAAAIIGDPDALVNCSIPDNLCCKITMELMEDPFITPSGITYEKDVLMNHFEKNGKFDPITRDPIDPDHCYPNLSIKQTIELFLEQNPWAFDYTEGETIEDIYF